MPPIDQQNDSTTRTKRRRTLADELVTIRGELAAAKQRAAADIADLQKKLQAAESMRKNAEERAIKAENEVEQISAVLDVLDGAPQRRKEVPGRWGGVETVDLSPITRLSAYLAMRK